MNNPAMNDLTDVPDSGDLLQRLDQLLEIGVALSSERDINKLLESILVAAKSITNADGGTLYRAAPDGRTLDFEIVRNDTLGIAMGGTSGVPIPLARSASSTSRAGRCTPWLLLTLCITTVP